MAAAGAEPGDLGRLLPEARAREREAEAALETLLGRRVRPPPPPRNPPPCFACPHPSLVVRGVWTGETPRGCQAPNSSPASPLGGGGGEGSGA